MPLDAVLQGPAIIEQMDTTVVLEDNCTARSDDDGNLHIEVS